MRRHEMSSLTGDTYANRHQNYWQHDIRCL